MKNFICLIKLKIMKTLSQWEIENKIQIPVESEKYCYYEFNSEGIGIVSTYIYHRMFYMSVKDLDIDNNNMLQFFLN